MVATLGKGVLYLSTVQSRPAEFARGKERSEAAIPEKNIYLVHHSVMDDRKVTINSINVSSMPRKRVQISLHNELGMTMVSARWMSHLLTPDQQCCGMTGD